ncbi:MAG: bifunctional riboflavin kinase/FAD synthetase [Acidimicrobiia bacterium]
MNVYRNDPSTWDTDNQRTAVAIGVFDGVHRGHAAVLRGLMDRSGEMPVVAMTFATHPDEVVTGMPAPPALAPLERRIELLGDLGIDGVAVIEFNDEVRQLSPEAFVKAYIVDGLNTALVSVGDDFRFGYLAGGSVDTLRICGGEYNFEVLSTPIVDLHGTEVRSSSIRAAVASGSVALAARMLGRPFEIDGVVVPGDARGRAIGFPTANITMPDRLVRPATGVYAVRCDVNGVQYDGVSNVGTRPTFGGGDETIEVHLLDKDEDLYGKSMRVQFIDRLRNEQHFTSVEALVFQINVDIEQARAVLAS